MMQYKTIYYLIGVLDSLVGALEVTEQRFPRWASLAVPFHDKSTNTLTTCICYVYGVPMGVALPEEYKQALYSSARLLAQAGGKDHQHEGVAALYQYGAKAGDEVSGILEFMRPQDFATRGLDKTSGVPRWHYRRIVYVAIDKASIVNAWTDVPMTDWEALSQFTAAIPMMSAVWGSDEPRPMKPTDPLIPDRDFWNTALLGKAKWYEEREGDETEL